MFKLRHHMGAQKSRRCRQTKQLDASSLVDLCAPTLGWVYLFNFFFRFFGPGKLVKDL